MLISTYKTNQLRTPNKSYLPWMYRNLMQLIKLWTPQTRLVRLIIYPIQHKYVALYAATLKPHYSLLAQNLVVFQTQPTINAIIAIH